MAKFKVSKDFKDFEKQLKDKLKELTSASAMKEIGLFAANLIKKRTRLGYGVAENLGERDKLLPLSDKYVELRRQLDDLSEATTPGRSNLTKTGQLLDSMTAYNAKQGEVTVGPQGTRNDSNLSNEELAVEVAKAGRPFNNISLAELKQINQELLKRLKDLVED